jgi:ABC-type transport system substrate-binding protein
VPQHVWAGRSETDVMGNNPNPVGSGPYLLLTYDQTKVVWVKNDNWWGKTLLGLDVKPTYIIDQVNGSNNVSLGQMLGGQIDLSNNFLPGINSIVSGIGGYGIQTYYAKPPYMLSANTAWLVTNDTKKPTSDPVFRRALAESINVSQIVNNVYGNIVAAANPTGLLPTWNQFVDKSVVAKYGYTYNPTDAKKILTAAGYKMGSDGYFRNKDGSTINLSLIVPNGWTDWMASIQSIAQSAKKAGIRITPNYPSYNDRTNKLQTGKFDLAIANDASDRQHPLGVLQLDVPPADPERAERRQRRALQERHDLEPGPAARRDVDEQRRRDEEDHLADPDHPAAGPADHPALVQRRVVAGEQHRMDQLAVLGDGQPALHACHVARVLEHGRRAHAHDAEAGPVSVSR